MGPLVGAAMTLKVIFRCGDMDSLPLAGGSATELSIIEHLGMPLSMTRNPTHFAQRKSV